MRATFVELPPFQRLRERYLGDASFKALKQRLEMEIKAMSANK